MKEKAIVRCQNKQDKLWSSCMGTNNGYHGEGKGEDKVGAHYTHCYHKKPAFTYPMSDVFK